MKPILLALVVVAVTPAVAAAQPSYGAPPPPPPSPFQPRQGTPMLGFSIGLGNLQSENNPAATACGTCDYSPIGLEVDGHIGGMLSERFGLMLELQAVGQTVDDSAYGSTSLTQFAAMIAGQYWVSPKLWLKGGVGVAHLFWESYDDYGSYAEPIDDGGAIMVGAGYEVLHGRTFAIDLQARVIAAGYGGIDDRLTAATIGLGFNWYGFLHGRSVIVIH